MAYKKRTLRRMSLLFWVVATEDRERAIKVVNEKRTQIIANDLWGKDKEVGELFSAGR